MEVPEARQAFGAARHMACAPHGLLVAGWERFVYQQHDVSRLRSKLCFMLMDQPVAHTWLLRCDRHGEYKYVLSL